MKGEADEAATEMWSCPPVESEIQGFFAAIGMTSFFAERVKEILHWTMRRFEP